MRHLKIFGVGLIFPLTLFVMFKVVMPILSSAVDFISGAIGWQSDDLVLAFIGGIILLFIIYGFGWVLITAWEEGRKNAKPGRRNKK